MSGSRPIGPILAAVALLVAFVALAAGSTLVLNAITTLDGKARDLVAEAVLAVAVLALIGVLGWWRSTGFSAPLPSWRHGRLLVLPIALTFLPFLGGVKSGVDGGTVALLVVGYALNSVAEDGMFRGIMPRVLRSHGLLVATVLSSVLFGLAHFGNILSRPDQSVAITAAQALGAGTQGFGLVALRLANATIWPVMLIHFLSDLFGQLGGVPIVLANVVESVVMLAYGVWVYRRYRDEMSDELAVGDK
ncbi:MAG TPA: CPBP family intramembrane glutamic endopeptidase [Candidatus Limnocylindrales bacterium]|nr:CPBP family intramembrane glutamic endopeptidase [Candidatus Limnocylindrales bacterium]